VNFQNGGRRHLRFLGSENFEISELWGVEVRHFPLTRLIAYTTACCYRTSRDFVRFATIVSN